MSSYWAALSGIVLKLSDEEFEDISAFPTRNGSDAGKILTKCLQMYSL